jgi:hypothetical protein
MHAAHAAHGVHLNLEFIWPYAQPIVASVAGPCSTARPRLNMPEARKLPVARVPRRYLGHGDTSGRAMAHRFTYTYTRQHANKSCLRGTARQRNGLLVRWHRGHAVNSKLYEPNFITVRRFIQETRHHKRIPHHHSQSEFGGGGDFLLPQRRRHHRVPLAANRTLVRVPELAEQLLAQLLPHQLQRHRQTRRKRALQINRKQCSIYKFRMIPGGRAVKLRSGLLVYFLDR